MIHKITHILIIIYFGAISIHAQNKEIQAFRINIDRQTVISYEQSHALIIGISDYTNGWNDLPGVKEDVKEVRDVLNLHGFRVEIYENLDKAQIDRVFSEFIQRYGQNENNRLLFYFAGHGYTVKTQYGDNLAYIVPKNAPLPKKDLPGFQAKAVETSQLEIYSKQIRSRHVLFLFDACFSGAMFKSERTVPDALSIETTGPVRQFIASGSENENVPDKSIFRRQFVQALSTKKADLYRDDYLSGSELGEYLQTRLVNMSRNKQHPQYGKIHHPVLNKGEFIFLLADSIIKPDNLASGTIRLKSKLKGEIFLDKKKVQDVQANTAIVLENILKGSHLLEIIGKETWGDTIWVYDQKLTQVLIIDDIYQHSNDWMIDSRDGNMYGTVKIDNQVWMAENLNYNVGEGSYCYDDSLMNCNIYGRLYTWEMAQKVCPPGWHIPKKAEWKKLLKNLGGHEGVNDFAFSQMVIGGGADFNAFFSGLRYNFGNYDFIGFHAGFWSTNSFNKDISEYVSLSKYGQNSTFQNGHKKMALSVRCVKN